MVRFSKDEIIIVTAGGAGMFCGSCMQDNSLAKALDDLGVNITLIPLYTPIRVDVPSQAEDNVFFGGLNIYFNDKIPLWSKLPRLLTRWLDHPSVIRWATSFGISNQAHELGQLTISMLQGNQGPHVTQVKELVNYLSVVHQPCSIIFSNILVSGTAPELRNKYKGHLAAIIQGDDLFLDQLTEQHRAQAIELIRKNVADFDCFYTHSEFYRDYIADYLGLQKSKFMTIPLGMEFQPYPCRVRVHGSPLVIGYFARIAPEKGFLELAQAFREFHQLFPSAKLKVGGYLAATHQPYYQQAIAQLGTSASAFNYIGSPETSAAKAEFYQSIDLLTVPVQFAEPKGLYALEAMSHGVPVVMPDRGALPELVERTSGGVIYPQNVQDQLIQVWRLLAEQPELYQAKSQAAYHNVRKHHHIHSTAQAIINSVPGMSTQRSKHT